MHYTLQSVNRPTSQPRTSFSNLLDKPGQPPALRTVISGRKVLTVEVPLRTCVHQISPPHLTTNTSQGVPERIRSNATPGVPDGVTILERERVQNVPPGLFVTLGIPGTGTE